MEIIQVGSCNHKTLKKRERCYAASLEVGGRGHEPRKVDSLQKLELAKKQVCFLQTE